ncbi:hypothetical protein C8Q75DRAFT_733610 [Abortiporus biennis]|nr:hypothetical protein C8Q75DRAFT_733610 [Abortiporus biennis]
MASSSSSAADGALASLLGSLDSTLGALFVGKMFGVTCVQAFHYYMHTGKRDLFILKASVALVMVLDVAQMAITAHMVYFYSISNYFNPAALLIIPWVFIHRIWKLSKSVYIAVILFILNCAVAVISFYLSHRVQLIGSLLKLKPITWLFDLDLASLASVDTIIAGTLCFYLWRIKTGFQRTDSQVDILIRYSVHTGAVTSLLGIAVLITNLVMPNNLVYIGIYVNLSKFYNNALLASLNARDMLRSDPSKTSEAFNSVQLSKISERPETQIVVNKSVEVHTYPFQSESSTKSFEHKILESEMV